MEEIYNFIMVWSLTSVSVSYCYGITKLVPKGVIRFFLFLPVFYLFLILPLNLTSVNLTCPTVFSVTWLTTFKLLQLVFGNGPLSDPSLPLHHFVLISCLPIKLQQSINPYSPLKKQENTAKNIQRKKVLERFQTNGQKKGNHHAPSGGNYKIGLRSPLHFAKKGLFLIFLVSLGSYKDLIPRNVLLFLVCIYVYIGLEVMLGVIAIICQILLGIELDSPFDDPYLSTSFQNFWSQRWNRVASSTLRSAVFDPIHRNLSWPLGRKWALIPAMLGTFLVSALMHEIIFYYLGRGKPAWGTTFFFLLHGICCLVESIVKREFDDRWQLPQIVIGPLIFLFTICTFMWLALPELMQYKVVDRTLEEYSAVIAFIKDLVLVWGKKGYNFILQNSQPKNV